MRLSNASVVDMISRNELIDFLVKAGMSQEECEEDIPEDIERIAQAAAMASVKMPGIGFASVQKRLNCFRAVCYYLDHLVEQGQIDAEETQMVLIILRIKNKAFAKAITMFDLRGERLSPLEIIELPKSAQTYLHSLKRFG